MNQMDEVLVMDKSGEIVRNDAGTSSPRDTDLTRDRSADVPAGLAQMRTKYGHDTPAGHRCSNILEMMDAGAKRSDIARQISELAELTK